MEPTRLLVNHMEEQFIEQCYSKLVSFCGKRKLAALQVLLTNEMHPHCTMVIQC